MKAEFTFYEKIIINNIDLSGYGVDNDGYLYDKIKTTYNVFRIEYGYNIARMGEKRAFCEWLQGLPSALTVPFYNYDILNMAYLHDQIKANATEDEEDKFLDAYFMNLSSAFFTLKDNL